MITTRVVVYVLSSESEFFKVHNKMLTSTSERFSMTSIEQREGQQVTSKINDSAN